jgi:hypothetical protein
MNPMILAAVAAMFLMGGGKAQASTPTAPKPKPKPDDDDDLSDDDDDDDLAADAKGAMDAGLPPGYVADKVTNGDDDDDDDGPSDGGASSSLPPVPVVQVQPDPNAEDDIAAAARDAADQFEEDQKQAAAAAAARPPSVTAKPSTPITGPTIDVYAGPENFQPPSASSQAPTSRPLPAGYSPVQARKEAVSLAAHLKRAGRAGYDRRMLEAWQKKAGLTPDRIYGGASRGALIYYGVKDPVAAFFPPTQTVPFVPPEKR